MRLAALLLLLVGTASAETAKPVYTDTRCASPPTVEVTGFAHERSKVIAKLGSPHPAASI